MASSKNKIPSSSVELNRFFDKMSGKMKAYVRKHFSSLSDDELDDIYQNASIALYENIVNGKLKVLTSSLSTYFGSICWNQASKHTLSIKPTVDYEDIYNNEKIDELLDEEPERAERNRLVRQIVNDLPKPCNEILWGYYADDHSMAELAIILNYNNADTVKSTKSRCMSKFKERAFKMFLK
ncbi:MAG: sigma-70 family RNA polymerase sigma factor [Bacteroidales bacterium]|nr:sigma-70 family RNA polymerase sigma factor [Bacteroidales bacterium]